VEDLLNFQENEEEFFNESENMTNKNEGFDEEDEETFATFTFKQDVENFVMQTELHHPIFKFYLEICKEIVKVYSDEEIQPSKSLKQIFGEQLEIQPILEKFEGNAIYPIPSNKITNLIGTNDHYFNRKFMRIRNGKDVYFKFEKLIDIKAKLIAAFSTKTASRIVGNYLNKKGARYSLIFSVVEIFYKHTKTYFGTKKISLIIYGKNYSIDDLLKTDYDILQALNPLWRFEYYIYKLKTKKNIGFNVDQNTLEKIKRECIQEIRNHISKNFQIVNPAGFNMIWECLYALSNIREESEPMSIQDLSEMIAPLDYRYKRQYLIKRYVDYGFDFYSYIAEALLTVIAPKVPTDHQVLQYIKSYLETNRRKSPVDIKALFKNAMLPSNRTTKLSALQRNVMIRIVWDLACERDWMTGNKITREWALLHHIRHDPATGLTIHSDNRLVNFACLTKNDLIDNNVRVEKKWEFWEKKFIITWEYLRNGKAPPHWSEDKQRKFKKERNSKNYLDNWIDVLENNDIF